MYVLNGCHHKDSQKADGETRPGMEELAVMPGGLATRCHAPAEPKSQGAGGGGACLLIGQSKPRLDRPDQRMGGALSITTP